jgi:hypothetical protein
MSLSQWPKVGTTIFGIWATRQPIENTGSPIG